MMLDDFIKERIDLFEKYIGDDTRKKTKSAGYNAMIQFGLELATKRGNLVEAIAESAKEPLKEFAKLGNQLADRAAAIKKAGIESGVEAFESAEDRKLEEKKYDPDLLEKLGEAKVLGKHHLATYIFNHLGLAVDPSSMFDVQVKRIHEYKRQHLLALWIVTQYLRIKNGAEFPSRTIIFGGKAAPGYYMAKLIVQFICHIADVINNDPDMDGKLRVVFLPNYSVKLGELVYPAADLSEQISTACKEASGTGNMKFQMNGALTIGTLDGANVEIRDLVGSENFFLFGHDEKGIAELWEQGYYPQNHMSSELWEVINLIKGGHFSQGDKEKFKPLLDNLLNNDPFCVFADFDDYCNAQDRVSSAWTDHERWNRMSLINTARSGFFSSDRSIKDYCKNIWGI